MKFKKVNVKRKGVNTHEYMRIIPVKYKTGKKYRRKKEGLEYV